MTHLFTHAQSLLAKVTPKQNFIKHLRLLFVAMMATVMVAKGQNSGTWVQKSNPPVSFGGGTFSIGNKGYVVGGYDGSVNHASNKVFQYDAITDTWTQLSNFPGGNRQDGIGFSIGNKGYFGTGFDNSVTPTVWKPDMWEYSPESDSWLQIANFPVVLRDAISFSIGGDGYVCAGVNGYGVVAFECYKYNQTMGIWSQVANIPPQTNNNNYWYWGADASSFSANGKGYICCGSNVGSSASDRCISYDPTTNQWNEILPFPSKRTKTISFSINNIGYVGLGTSSDYQIGYSSLYKYDDLNNQWIKVSDAPHGGSTNALSFTINGKGYARAGFFYEFTPITLPAPTITSFTPTSAAVGSTITITGTNFTGATGVTIGGVAATNYNVVDATTITAVLGTGAASGNVSVTTVGGSATSGGFILIPPPPSPPPTITSFTPTSAAVGSTITITGTNFTGATGVTIGGKPAASFTFVNATTITAVVGSGATSGNVVVTTGGGGNATLGGFISLNIPLNVAIAANGATSFCSGAGTVTLSATAGSTNTGSLTYQWKNSGTTIDYATSNTYTASTSGSYTLTITSSDGGSVTSNAIIVTVNPLATKYQVSVTNNGIACYNSSVTISLSSSQVGYNYQLSVGGVNVGSSMPGTENAISFTNISTAGNSYSIVATNNSGTCPVTMDGYVNVKTSPAVITPQIIINGSTATGTTLCTGASVELRPAVFGYSNYQWYKDGTAMPGVTNSNITVGAANPGSYTLKGTNGDGCWSTFSNPFSVASASPNSKPTISAPSNLNLCNGTITLTSPSADGDNQWFKDGVFIGVTTKNLSVTDAGSYTLKVGNGNCSSSFSDPIVVTRTAPVSSFTITGNTTQCLSGNAFTFNSTSTGTGLTYTWYFSDGTTSTFANPPVKTYAQAGTYNVQLDVSNACGSNSSMQTVVVSPQQVAPQAISGKNAMVVGDTYLFTDGTTGGVWSVVDVTGTSVLSVAANGTVTANSVGTADVKYTVTGTCGSATSTIRVVVSAACTVPVSSFTITGNTTQCLSGNAFTFNSTSTGTNLTYTWYFSDGTTSTVANPPVKTYAQAGTYNVQLDVSNACGSNSSTRTVVVSPQQVAPQAISGKNAMVVGDTYQFTDGTTGGVWSVVDVTGTSVLSVAANGTVTANSVGTADVKYTVTGTCGSATSTIRVVVSAACTVPVSSFTITGNTTQCLSGNAFTFGSTSTGTGLTYTWYFSDGTTSTVANPPVKTYAQAGTYNVQLDVSNACGSNSSTRTVVVSPQQVAPQAISGKNAMVVGDTYLFTNGTTGGVWSVVDVTGTSVLSVAANGTVTANSVGTADVKYTVTGTCGSATSTIRVVVSAACTVPVSSFTITGNTTQCLSGNTFTFNSTSTGTGLTYTWYFSDGTTSTVANPPVKTYAQAGTYNVQLDVSNACGSNSSMQTVVVSPQQVAPQAISGKNAMVVGDTYQFTDGTTGGVWSVVDVTGTSVLSVAANGTVTANSVGTADVKYTVTGTCGSATSTIRVVVSAACTVPVSSFTITGNTTQCLSGNAFTFNSTSTGTGLTYTWYFSDGTTSTVANPPVKIYTQAGTYNVQLDVSNACGSNSSMQTVVVSPQQVAPQAISGKNAMVVNDTYLFTDGTTGGVWSVVDVIGTSVLSVAANGTVTANSVGTADVKYTVTGTCGSATSTIRVVVSAACTVPVSSFTITGNTTQCLSGNAFTFNSTSTGTNLTYTWYFSDGTTSTVANPPVKTYAQAGTYNVQLDVSNACGSNSSMQTVVVSPQQVAPQAISGKNAMVVGDTYLFTDGTTGGVWSVVDVIGTSVLSVAANGTVTANSVGTADVKYTVTGTCGSATSTIRVVVSAACTVPVSSFTITGNTTQCLSGNAFTFASTSTGTGLTYTWYFSDGTTSTVANPPVKTYAQAGTYNVQLDVSNACGSNSSMQTVVVSPQQVAPQAISGKNAMVVGDTYQFTDGTTGGVWSVVDVTGTSVLSVAANGTVTANSVGTADVKYTVTGTCGSATSTIRVVVSAACTVPVSSFTITGNTTQCLSGNAFTFNSTSTGTNLTYTWYFSDGTTSTVANPPVKTYAQAGTYNVQLDVSNACGSNSSMQTVVVSPQQVAPQAISGKNAMVVGDTYQFTDGTTGGVWSVVDVTGTSVLSVAANGTVTANSVGTADVKYTVTGTCGSATSTIRVVVSAACTVPVSSFTITGNTTQCLSGNAFTFNSTSTGTGLTYTWYFGDGSSTTSTANNISHTYSQKGTFTVQLSANNGCGSSSVTKTITVTAKPDIPQSISGRGSMVVGESYVFSSGSSDVKTWISSDPTVATVDVVTGEVTALKIGQTAISYTVTNGCGTTSSAPLVVNVSAAPVYLSLYPNPSNTYIQVAFVAPSTLPTTITIYNASSIPVRSTVVYPNSVGSYISTNIDISSLPNSIYTVSVSNQLIGIISTKQFVKQ